MQPMPTQFPGSNATPSLGIRSTKTRPIHRRALASVVSVVKSMLDYWLGTWCQGLKARVASPRDLPTDLDLRMR